MLQLLLQTNKVMKRLSSEEIVIAIEFHGGGEEILGDCRVEGMFDFFRRQDSE